MRKLYLTFVFLITVSCKYSREDYTLNSTNVLTTSNDYSTSISKPELFSTKTISKTDRISKINSFDSVSIPKTAKYNYNVVLKSKTKISLDSVKSNENLILNDLESTSSCYSLSIQLKTQFDRISNLEKIASRSNREEGYREARDIKKENPSVFFEPKNQEKGQVVFSISLGTVGFAHSHTLGGQARGFYSLADVKAFLRLAELTYESIKDEKVKTFTMYDLYSTLIFGNQIYSMKIDDLTLYKKFHENENGIKRKMINRLNGMYNNVDIHFNFFKDDYYSHPDENKEALNRLSSKVLSKIGIRIYRLENYEKKNKEPKWKKLLPNEKGTGIFVNPC